MKKSILLFLFFSYSLTFSQDIKTEVDSFSYSIGHELGKNMFLQKMNLNDEALIKGIKDGLHGSKAQIPEEVMTKIILRVQEKALQEKEAKREKIAEENLKKSNEFLKNVLKDKDVKKTNTGLLYKIIKRGEGISPTVDDKVLVNYRGSFPDGKEFDSSYKRGKPLILSLERVILGWREALPMMNEGAKWILYIPPNLGYGEYGTKNIPPNQTLVFEIELLKVIKK